MKKRTKIVCTIGPASERLEVLGPLMEAGMNVARLNFSHGTHASHLRLLKRIRSEANRRGLPIGVLLDLQGPKIRIGDLPKKGVILKKGTPIVFTTASKPVVGDIPVTYDQLHRDMKPGQRILMDDGLLDAHVDRVAGRRIFCTVGTGGTLFSHKGMNLPETTVRVSAFSKKDQADAAFGVQHGVDWIALSFVRSAKEVIELRRFISKQSKSKKEPPIRIIAKIEKREAIDRIDEILEVVDGIMVARGDLGVEIPAEEVPLIQKTLIEKARALAKPVVVATQMLDSMIRNPRPTRAEVSDVANAVIDHADAVMLSGETATGAYPLEAVKIMARIARRTERSKFDDVQMPMMERLVTGEEAMSRTAGLLARSTKAKGILVASCSGSAARVVSRYRPEMPIFTSTVSDRVCRQLALSWGVDPFLLSSHQKLETLIASAMKHLLETKKVRKGHELIVVAGELADAEHSAGFVEIRKA